jgi:hypothetical protein
MGDDSATVFFEWQIADARSKASLRRGNNVFVVSRSLGAWTIVAGQVARKPAP